MKHKFGVAVAAVMACTVGAVSPALAQSWVRQAEDDARIGAGTVSVFMGCEGTEDERIGTMIVGVASSDSAHRRLRNNRTYVINFIVDGHPVATRQARTYLEDGEDDTFGLRDISPIGQQGDYGLYDLAEELRRGRVLTISIPEVEFTRNIPLTGSSRALMGIYGLCGMRPTGTGVMN